MTEVRIQKAENESSLGNIYIGRVEKIAKNIEAAFVMISPSQRCYLPLSQCHRVQYASGQKKRDRIAAGDEILVQVSRDAMKEKLPSVQTNLNFTGHYLVITTGDLSIGFSKKISVRDKKHLEEFLGRQDEIRSDQRDFGVIVRTNAADAREEDIQKELQYLIEKWNRVRRYGDKRTCFSCIYESENGFMEMVRDVYHTDLVSITTDISFMYQEIKESLEVSDPEKARLLKFYDDPLLSLQKLYSMEKQLADAMKEKVWLSSGGFLIIQQTEAFAAIDVNTGKFTGKKKAEETFRKINLEAAQEIVRQIRLRNLSGMILVDFINMENPDHEEELFHVMKNQMKSDPVKGRVVDFTALHILEMTRKKIRKSLAEEIASLDESS